MFSARLHSSKATSALPMPFLDGTDVQTMDSCARPPYRPPWLWLLVTGPYGRSRLFESGAKAIIGSGRSHMVLLLASRSITVRLLVISLLLGQLQCMFPIFSAPIPPSFRGEWSCPRSQRWIIEASNNGTDQFIDLLRFFLPFLRS